MNRYLILMALLVITTVNGYGQSKPKQDTIPVILQYIDTVKYPNYTGRDTLFYTPITQIQWVKGYEVIVKHPDYRNFDGSIAAIHEKYLNADKKPFPKSFIVKPF